jgi:hypothetical protein
MKRHEEFACAATTSTASCHRADARRVVARLAALPRSVVGGYLAATVGGLTGAASGAWVGWQLLPLLDLQGDPNLGPANVALGLATQLAGPQSRSRR